MNDFEDRLTEIGRIGKVHGLEGVVRVIPEEDASGLLQKGNLLYLKSRRGDLIPSRILDIRIEKKHNQVQFFVKFDRIADRTEAESFRDTTLFADQPAEELPGAEPLIEDVAGFRVIDEQGTVGVVSGVMENPAHPILEVETDEPSGSLLIPWVDEYVRSVDGADKTVTCQNLEPLRNL